MRILVVDDSEDVREITAATLASGYEDVVCAASGPHALSKPATGCIDAREPVDVIPLDIPTGHGAKRGDEAVCAEGA